MDLDKFLQDLGLPVNADLDAVEQAFMGKLKERLLHVVQNYNETELQQEDQWLRGYLKQYFDYAITWAGKETGKYKDIKEFDTAPGVKQQARAVVAELQDYIAEFVSCYMHLNRFMTLLRDEIKAEEIKVASGGGAERTRWTADAGVLIDRYRKEKKALVARTERMGGARALLESIENDFIAMRACAVNLFGRDKAEPHMRKFFSALRVLDFRKANRALKNIKEGKKKFGLDQKTANQNLRKLMAHAEKIIAVVEKEQKVLTSEENRVFLKPVETDVAYNSDIKELQKIKAFLAKYHLPYMQYKLDTLGHLKDKLLVMHTLESLMALYKRLLMGIAVPLKDIKTVRLYEEEVLNHTKYLLSGHFTELPKILQRGEETVEEFRQSRVELNAFEELDLTEIEITEPQAAQA